MSFHKSSMGRGSDWGRNDHTLADYIRRKNQDEAFKQVVAESASKKLTFEEWWETQVFAGFKDDPVGYLRNVWQAAQENCR